MKCDNCDRDAVYLIERESANTIYLCNYDLPRHMYAEAAAGAFDFPEVAPAKKKKAVSEPEVVEPEVVEPEVVETPAETSDENL
jgi:hypothetical protein